MKYYDAEFRKALMELLTSYRKFLEQASLASTEQNYTILVNNTIKKIDEYINIIKPSMFDFLSAGKIEKLQEDEFLKRKAEELEQCFEERVNSVVAEKIAELEKSVRTELEKDFEMKVEARATEKTASLRTQLIAEITEQLRQELTEKIKTELKQEREEKKKRKKEKKEAKIKAKMHFDESLAKLVQQAQQPSDKKSIDTENEAEPEKPSTDTDDNFDEPPETIE